METAVLEGILDLTAAKTSSYYDNREFWSQKLRPPGVAIRGDHLMIIWSGPEGYDALSNQRITLLQGTAAPPHRLQ